MKSYHHNSNDYLLNNPINITYDELLVMDDTSFEKWCLELERKSKELG